MVLLGCAGKEGYYGRKSTHRTGWLWRHGANLRADDLCRDGYRYEAGGRLRTCMLTNAIYVSGWEERRVTVPVEEARYEAGLRQRQEMEKSV